MTARTAADTVGSRIKRAREALSMSQTQLGALIGVGQNAVWRYETDRMQPRAKVATQLAQALGVSVSWIMHGHEAPAPAAIHPVLQEYLDSPEGQTVSAEELEQLRALPWTRTPKLLTYHYALMAIRSLEPGEEAVESAELTEDALERATAKGGKRAKPSRK